MSHQNREPRSQERREQETSGPEWVGGVLKCPVDDPAPRVLVWLEQPGLATVAWLVLPPGDAEGTLAEFLTVAMEQPLEGPPRRPARIRVSDAAAVPDLEKAVGGAIPIAVAACPELDAIREQMKHRNQELQRKKSYFAGGRIRTGTVAKLFEAASVLTAVRPWNWLSESQVLRMDVPALGVKGACVSILDVSFLDELPPGFVVFPSYQAYKRHRDGFEVARLSLELETEDAAPEKLVDEARRHGWRLIDTDDHGSDDEDPIDVEVYPVLQRHDDGGTTQVLVQSDMQLAVSSAIALSALCIQRGHHFLSDRPTPVSVSYFLENDLEVRLTHPHLLYMLFKEAGPAMNAGRPSAQPKVSRNAPCPCGSGRKYKMCHLPVEQARRAAPRAAERDVGRGDGASATSPIDRAARREIVVGSYRVGFHFHDLDENAIAAFGAAMKAR